MLIDSVSSIFSRKIAIDIQNGENNIQFLVVVEDAALSAIKRLHLENLPTNSYAVSLDVSITQFSENEKIQFSRLNHYLNKSNDLGINKKCDLVLFTEEQEGERIYIFDLKSSDPDPNDVCNQLANSEIYIKYILELVSFFYKHDTSTVPILKVIGVTRTRKRQVSINEELKAKINKKRVLFEKNKIKEVQIYAEANRKGTLQFNQLSKLF
ncbi:hypothetical protein H2Y56_00480 [Pectobacterium aroidearum]|uniref:Uncharacterized protein n=1 Tax=Pectobacterium aroidearum TaxID=1201031 RepID=A0ABR5Z7P3_9GAMM|nr:MULTISPECIES: hypothetical protein [Pectobacterium]MBA5197799.1 hypothetical protein [Pectobacterium aroidearum]MBA5230592.1 hypothetical protein [Pectobacterium aroidearum]GKV95436.1 hypothetical protein PEC301645_28830 [Pectobacterium carotovorum subsp. carotovorum]